MTDRGDRGERSLVNRVTLAILAALFTIAAIDPRGFGLLAWVALVPFFVALAGAGRGATVAIALSYTIVLIVGNVGAWLVPAAERYFDLGAWQAAAVVLPPLTALATLHGLLLGGALRLGPRPAGAGFALWAGALWVCWEAIRTMFFPYYPGGVLAPSQSSVLPAAQIASLLGAPGITFVLVVANAGIAAAVSSRSQGRPMMAAVMALAIAGGGSAWGLVRLAGAGRADPGHLSQGAARPRVALVDIDARRQESSTLERYLEVSGGVQPGVTLVVWPESALTTDIEHDRAAWRAVSRYVDRLGAPLLAGGFGSGREAGGSLRRYNSMHLVGPGSGLRSYHKRRLVPFAERWPAVLGAGPEGVTSLAAGDGLPVLAVGELPLGVLICFEITDAPAARTLVREGARVLVNPTNDAWFVTAAPHAPWAVLRAIENGVPVIRAANAGRTMVVDGYGRVVLSRPAETSMTVVGIPPAIARPTPYTRTGDVMLLACAIGVVVGWIAASGRRTRPAVL